jgi:hypothetical protein
MLHHPADPVTIPGKPRPKRRSAVPDEHAEYFEREDELRAFAEGLEVAVAENLGATIDDRRQDDAGRAFIATLRDGTRFAVWFRLSR